MICNFQLPTNYEWTVNVKLRCKTTDIIEMKLIFKISNAYKKLIEIK